MHAQLIASGRTVYETPVSVFEPLNKEFSFTLDPCASPENAKCPTFFTEAEDGLTRQWAPHSVFMNPPYGRDIGLWMSKAVSEWRRGALVVALVPASTDTGWWHEYAALGEVRFPRGRIKFGGMKNSAPFPSAIVVYRP